MISLGCFDCAFKLTSFLLGFGLGVILIQWKKIVKFYSNTDENTDEDKEGNLYDK